MEGRHLALIVETLAYSTWILHVLSILVELVWWIYKTSIRRKIKKTLIFQLNWAQTLAETLNTASRVIGPSLYTSESSSHLWYTSSTAQGGGGSFKNWKPMRVWLLWIRDGRAKPLMDWKVLEVSSLSLSFSLFSLFLYLSLIIYRPTYWSIYLSISLSLCIYLSLHVSIYVSIDLSIFLSIYLPIYLSIYLCIYLSIDLSIYLYIYLSIYLFVYLSIYLSIDRSVYLSINLSFYLAVSLSICLSVYLSIYLSICLSV